MTKKWIYIAAVLVMMFVLMQAFDAIQNKMKLKEELPLTPVDATSAAEEVETQKGLEEVTAETDLPFSVLYYGQILEMTGNNGNISRLVMESPKNGEWIMNLGQATCFVNSGEYKAFDPSELQTGDRVYVFHSSVSTMSLPPHSSAYVVVKNIPMDAGCPMYHQVEKITDEDDCIRLTVDGGKMLSLSAEDHLLSYDGQEINHSELHEGQRIMGWYWDRGEDVVRASHLMILPDLVQK